MSRNQSEDQKKVYNAALEEKAIAHLPQEKDCIATIKAVNSIAGL